MMARPADYFETSELYEFGQSLRSGSIDRLSREAPSLSGAYVVVPVTAIRGYR